MRSTLLVFMLVLGVAIAVQTAQQPGQVIPASRADRQVARDPTVPGAGTIRGRILIGAGRPAVRAMVRLVGLNGPNDTITTDIDGRYEFAGLKPDVYRLTASKSGYLTLDYGQKRAFEKGTLLVVAGDETLADIDVTLPSGGAITGRITDENGEPLEGVVVLAMQSVFSGGRRQLMPIFGVEPRLTDDMGRYRLFGVPPGSYILNASPTPRPLLLPARNQVGYVPTAFPGTAVKSEAQPVTIGLSETLSGVDFALVSTRSSRLSGYAFDSNNRPLDGTIALTTSDRWGGLSVAMNAKTNADGSFLFVRVPPGDYVLQAIGPRPPDQRGEGEFRAVPLIVNGEDIADFEVRTSAGSSVRGHVTIEAEARSINLKDFVFVLAPMDITKAPANDLFLHRWRADNDGTFQMAGVTGPRRLRLFSGPRSWMIRSVMADGVDVTDEELSFGSRAESIANLEIVLTHRASTLSGTAVDERGRPVSDYTAVLFAIDPRRWYPQSRFVQFTRPRRDGSFAFTSVSAGEYYIAAVDWMQGDDLSGEWQDPAFLDTLSRGASRVSIGEGDQATTSTRLINR